jgi:uncharacterized protein YbbK (DUF523 family)
VNCRYDGKNNLKEDLIQLGKEHTLIPVCPEQLGGLPTPRIPVEIINDKMINKDGKDVTKEFNKGAYETLELAKLYNCKLAILKENSPSCGSGIIYDGTFSGRLTTGNGVTAELLKKEGIKVFGESFYKEIAQKS